VLREVEREVKKREREENRDIWEMTVRKGYSVRSKESRQWISNLAHLGRHAPKC